MNIECGEKSVWAVPSAFLQLVLSIYEGRFVPVARKLSILTTSLPLLNSRSLDFLDFFLDFSRLLSRFLSTLSLSTDSILICMLQLFTFAVFENV